MANEIRATTKRPDNVPYVTGTTFSVAPHLVELVFFREPLIVSAEDRAAYQAAGAQLCPAVAAVAMHPEAARQLILALAPQLGLALAEKAVN